MGRGRVFDVKSDVFDTETCPSFRLLRELEGSNVLLNCHSITNYG